MASRTTADVEVKIFGNIKDFSQKMNAAKFQAMSFQQQLLAMSGVMKSVGRSMTMAITLPVVAGLALAVKQASNLEESVNAVQVTFGKASKGILDLGKNAANAVGMSAAEFNTLAVQFSNFAKAATGPGGDVVKTMDVLTTRVADFASVMNLNVADAARIFQSGLAGESEPLRKYGIDVSAAAVSAFAYANGIAQAGKELTETQKVQARYGLIMQQTAKMQGDFANTSGSLANSLRILSSNAKDLGAEIGAVLVPAISKVVGWLTGLAKGINSLPGFMKSAIVYIGLFAAAMGPLLWAFGSAVQGIKAMRDAWKLAKRLLRIGTWQAETTAINLNTTAVERNSIARGKNALIAPGSAGAGAVATGASTIGTIGTGTAGLGVGSAAGTVATSSLAAVAGGIALIAATPLLIAGIADKLAPNMGKGPGAVARGSASDEFRKAAVESRKSNLSILDSNWKSIAASHKNSSIVDKNAAATAELTDAVEANTEVQKEIWQMTAAEVAAAAAAKVPTNDQLLAFTANWGKSNPALHDRTGQVGMRRMAAGGIVRKPTVALIGESGPEAVVPLNKGMGAVHVHIGTLVGTDERAARQLSDMVGRHIMRGVMRGMVGQNG